MFCYNCGKELNEGDLFCGSCGSDQSNFNNRADSHPSNKLAISPFGSIDADTRIDYPQELGCRFNNAAIIFDNIVYAQSQLETHVLNLKVANLTRKRKDIQEASKGIEYWTDYKNSFLTDEFCDALSLVPEKYRTASAFHAFADYFTNGRANSFKEAFNLYEVESRQAAMQYTQLQQLQSQQKANKQLRNLQILEIAGFFIRRR